MNFFKTIKKDNFKKFLFSKTFWVGIVTIAYGITQFNSNSDVAFQSILSGLGLIFLRNGVAKLEK